MYKLILADLWDHYQNELDREQYDSAIKIFNEIRRLINETKLISLENHVDIKEMVPEELWNELF